MKRPRQLLLKCFLSPGDVVMLTAAVRDLHLNYPGRFVTDVRTSCPELWEHNPYLTPLRARDPAVQTIHCHYPLINRSNQAPYHCLHGFIDYLNQRLDLQIKPTLFQGDIHLSDEERLWYSQVHELTGQDTPFWIVVAGGKFDVTIKWWDIRRFQEVVDHFRGRIQFVQVGDGDDYHPPLNGVIDLRSRTDLRQLVRLVHHAQGVLCPVTSLMHLAAAVPGKDGAPSARPCVVVAGGREPVHWEAYPTHQFIHTIGALPCCQTGGCWKCRTVPLGDGDERDEPGSLCANVTGQLPRCMDMITAAEVIRRIESYFQGGACRYLAPGQARIARAASSYSRPNLGKRGRLTEYNGRVAMDRFAESLPEPPRHYRGRGIVICAGGVDLFTNAWVCIQMLRRVGCRLPVELWHLGESEMDPAMVALVGPLGVRCVNALEVRRAHPVKRLGGWGLKAFALLYSPFRETLLLDADNVPLVDPEFLFDTAPFQQTGAIFWPDLTRWDASEPIWGICGIPFRDEPEFETGQIVVDKGRCWRPLRLALWMNEHSDFFYEHLNGDKDTFRLAFRKLDQTWSMPRRGVQRLPGTMCQHDFDGRRIFQHRNMDKWDLFLRNRRVEGFRGEAMCRAFIRDLQTRWDGRMARFQGNGIPVTNRLHLPSSDQRPPDIAAVMISCPQRAGMLGQTLKNLAATDWGDRAVEVQMDQSRSCPSEASHRRNTFAALQRGLASQADYLLFLEDDLEFNRFFHHNLFSWQPLRDRRITLASFFNPGFKPLACDVAHHSTIVDPAVLFGSLALLLSRDALRHLLAHWTAMRGPTDLIIPRLVAQLNRPIYLHTPSLVQHRGQRSSLGHEFIRAADFDPRWKSPLMSEGRSSTRAWRLRSQAPLHESH